MTEILRPPKALVLTAPGINRDHATKEAFKSAGGEAEIVHLNQLKSGEVKLDDFQILSIPGGFSYSDHIQGGRVLALQLQDNILADQIYEHLEKGRFILGVCNGFQVLVQSGLLPFGKIQPLYQNQATLTNNVPDQFQSRWIFLSPANSECLFAEHSVLNLPVAHGEGRFLTINKYVAEELQRNGQIVYQYCTPSGQITQEYPDSPNSSTLGIAAICDPSGQILGMMPHAEDFVDHKNHPNWRRQEIKSPDGLRFFQNLISTAKQL